MALALALVLILLTGLSLHERTRQKTVRATATAGDGQPQPVTSPFSQAVVELVATAGGVYLALIALVNFLKIAVPPAVTLLGVSFEPVAALSLLIALVQPYILKRKGN